MQKYAIIASAIGAFATIVLTAPEGQANSRLCRQLQNETQELRQIGSRAYRASLQRDLDRAERQVRRAGCSGFRLLFGGRAKRQCHALRADVSRLRQQVRTANIRRSPDRRLRAVEAEMRRHGCGANSGQASAGNSAHEQAGYRTLCVRKCDGYYFPIGFATPKSQLKRDQAACGSFYPDSEAELYVVPSGSDEQHAMISVKGESYAEQPFAFAYRSAYQPACAAMLHAGLKAVGEQARQKVEIKTSAIVPIPVPRPSLDEPTAVMDADERQQTASARLGTTGIRVVGPATPYIVSAPVDASISPLATNSAPKRIAPTRTDPGPSWFERLSSLITPAAQADEGD